MSRFYGSMSNSRGGEATAMSGPLRQVAHLRGWNHGVEVQAYVDGADRDAFAVWETGGSNEPARSRLLGTLVEGEWIPAAERVAS